MDREEGYGIAREDQAMAASTSSGANVIDPYNIDLKDKTLQASTISHEYVNDPKMDRKEDHVMHEITTSGKPLVIVPEIDQEEDLTMVASTSGMSRIIDSGEINREEGSGIAREDQAMAASTSSGANVIDPYNIDLKDKTMQASTISHEHVNDPKMDRNEDHVMHEITPSGKPLVIVPEIDQATMVASTSGMSRIIDSEINEEEHVTRSLSFIVGDAQDLILTLDVDKKTTPMTLFKEWAERGELTYNPDNVIVEKLEDFSLERILEDHELILKSFKTGKDDRTKTFFIKNDEERFKYLIDEKYFPIDETVPVHEDGEYLRNEEDKHTKYMKYTLAKTEKAPLYFGELFKKLSQTSSWKLEYFVIKEGELYGSETVPEDPVDTTDKKPLLNLEHYDIYSPISDNEEIDGKSIFSFCLKCWLPAELDFQQFFYFACETLLSRQKWITALRINKYGNCVLRKNFKKIRALKTDHWPSSILDLGSQIDKELEDLVNPRDKEIRDMVGLRVKAARNGEIIGGGILWKLTTDIHYALPWFHPNFTREQAKGLLSKRMKEDGLFLIREEISGDSRVYVLDYIGNNSLLHKLIVLEAYSQDVKHYSLIKKLHRKVYKLEGGTFRFYDLVQLVEFHKLNKGSLETKLCKYVGPKETKHLTNIRNP